jgi:hypothetical protein
MIFLSGSLEDFYDLKKKICVRNLQEKVSCTFIGISLIAQISSQDGNKIYHSKTTTLHSSWFCEAYL